MDIISNEKYALSMLLSFVGSARNLDNATTDRLYYKFGSLYNIVHADEQHLLSIKGMNEKKLKFIKHLPVILECYLKSRILLDGQKANTYRDVIKYFRLTLRDLKFEMFSYALFNAKKEVIDINNIFRGSISRATIYPREIIDLALSKSASYIVVAHNHPSGEQTPSDEDIILTESLYRICSSVDIILLDHIIIAKNKKYSFKKKGMIKFFEESINKQTNNLGEYYA